MQGTGSRENLFVGSQTHIFHSDPSSSSLRTETTSWDELQRVQLSCTLGSGVGVSLKPQDLRTPSSAPAWIQAIEAAARLS